jgi:hypothetical protein
MSKPKQKGGIIDNPLNCNNDMSPIYLNDITANSDVIYVGNKLEGNKYNCYTPKELKKIITTAIDKDEEPLDQLTRRPLEPSVIEQIVKMYPITFQDQDKELHINVTPNDIIPMLLQQFRITTPNDSRQFKHIYRIKTLKEVLKKYDNPNDPPNKRWDDWYNDPDIPMNYKDAMINLFKLFEDGFDVRYMKNFSLKLLSTDLIELINYPVEYGMSSDKNFNFHYFKVDEDIYAIAITYILNLDESIERLNMLGIENTEEWTVYKLATIATTGYYGKDDNRTDKYLAKEFLSKIMETNSNKKLFILSYDFDYSIDDENFTYFVTDILDFYNVAGVSEDYAELYATFNNDNEPLYISKSDFEEIIDLDGGFKKKKSTKILYKRRNSKKKTSKKKSLKRKSKKKSSKRRNSNRK